MQIKNIKVESGVIWNLLGGAVPAIIALGGISGLVLILESEAFVFVSLMLSVCLFLQVYDFGLSRALHYFQRHFADAENQQRFLTSALCLSLMIGVVFTLLGWILMPIFVSTWLDVEPDMKNEASLAFQIVCLAVLPSVMMHVFKGVLEANGAFKAVNLAKIIAIFTLFFGALLAALLSTSLVVMAIVIVVGRLISLWAYQFLSGMPVLYSKIIHYFDLRLIKSLLSHVGLAAIAGFISAAFIYGDRFFVSGFINATEYSIYVVSQDFLSRFLLVPWSLAMVLVPVINSVIKRSNEATRKSIRNAYLQTLALSGLFVVAAISIIFWLIPVFVPSDLLPASQVIALIITLGVVFGAFAQIPMVGLFTLGKVNWLCWIFIVELLIYLSFAPWCLREYGLLGAGWIWTGRLVIEACLLNYFFVRALDQS